MGKIFVQKLMLENPDVMEILTKLMEHDIDKDQAVDQLFEIGNMTFGCKFEFNAFFRSSER